MPADDLGHPGSIRRPSRRVVSLVPSLTEAIASVDTAAIVGATKWCTHPADLAAVRVRGTKNPDVARMITLAPDVVIANKEENRLIDVQRLRRAGIPAWVTDIGTVAGAFDSLRRLFTDALGWPIPSWLVRAETLWRTAPTGRQIRVAIPVWRNPWMVVGGGTFASDIAARLGWVNCFEHVPRYPHVTLDEILQAQPDLVVLPDEPYHFHAGDGPEAFDGLPTRLISGRLLTWYGPSLIEARRVLGNSDWG